MTVAPMIVFSEHAHERMAQYQYIAKMMLLRVSSLLVLTIGALAELTTSPRDFTSDLSLCPKLKNDSQLRRQLREQAIRYMQQSCLVQRDLNSCCDLINAENEESRPMSGIYSVLGRETFCDMDFEGGGWILVQRSYAVPNESKPNSFSKTWEEYERGFGDLNKVFWLGLETLHNFTSRWSATELQIDLFSSNGGIVHHAHYDRIVVGDKRSNYKLSVSGFNGTVPDYLSYHNGASFSSMDRDNDNFHFINCAQLFGSGWWYTPQCGPVYQYYYRFEQQYAIWGNYTVTGMEMKIRPINWLCRNV